MTKSFPLTAMQKMYLNGEQNTFFLGGSPAYLYFRTEIDNFDREKFEQAFSDLILHHTLLHCQITDSCIRNSQPEIAVTYMTADTAHQEEENQRIAETMRIQFQQAKPRKNYLVFVLLSPEKPASVHFIFSNLVLDGISIGLLLKQLYSRYHSKALPETIDYQEYAAQKEQYLTSETYINDKNYFNTLYEQFPAEDFDFPYLKNPEEIKNCHYQNLCKTINKEVYTKLETLAEQHKISVFVLLMTVFGEIVSRYSGQKAFFLNIPCSLRATPDVQETAGLFSNFLIFPFQISKQNSILENAVKLSPAFKETSKHRNFSGEEAIKLLRKLGKYQHSMNIVFTVVPVPDTENSYPLKEIRACTNQTILECDLYVQNHQANICLSCPEGLYSEHFLESFGDMLTASCRKLAEEKSLLHLPLPDCELQIIQKANHKISYEFEHVTLNEIICGAFLRNEQQNFLICGGRTYTYSEILKKAYAVSKRAAFHENRVALLMPKCEGLIVAQYAALLFAGAYMPFDTSLSATEIAHCLKAADIHEIITCREFEEKINAIQNVRPIWIEKTDIPAEETLNVQEILQKIHPTSEEDIRIVINTSGTTGKPKSILLKDSSLVNCFLNSEKIFGIKDKAVILSLTNHGHDMSIFDSLIVNFVNSCIVLPTEQEKKEPSAWAELIQRYQISIWQGVPSFMEMFMTYLEEETIEFPSVKQIIQGGEFLTPSLAGKILKRFPNVSLFNVCGPTETTIWNIFHQVTQKDIASGVLPIGVPFSGVEYHILNADLEECPVGVKGIIFCAGCCLSPGYAGNPEETSKKFIFWNGKKVYHTGDIGFRREDGEIIICGREDFQVKIHGKRVELSGIHAVLASHPAIQSVSIVYLEEQAKLAAVYTGDSSVDENVFINYLKASLPDYMIPKLYICVEEIPLSKVGKPDRNALQKIVLEVLEQQRKEHHSDAVSDDIRTEILEIIAEEIDDDPEETANFFEVGGDSLSAVKICARVGKLTGKRLAVFDFIEAETIGDWLDMIL